MPSAVVTVFIIPVASQPGVTVNSAVSLSEEPSSVIAVMVLLPTATPVARPVLLPMEATARSPLLQLTELVISWLLPSDRVAVAPNCWFCPTATVALSGVTASSVMTALVTFRAALPD
ncbi:hypothetical protein D3C78_895690 [compost metagenome]